MRQVRLSGRRERSLRQAGHDAVLVRDYGLAEADAAVIFERAAQEDRVVVSADTDFGTLLAQRQAQEPSVVLFRGATPRRPQAQAALLVANLPAVETDLLQGALMVIEPRRVRVARCRFCPVPKCRLLSVYMTVRDSATPARSASEGFCRSLACAAGWYAAESRTLI
jgi:predicted nuclease of predicted toxin-antitoxin system